MPEAGVITIANGVLAVPDQPILPFIEGDGTGPDIWAASVRVLDAAVAKAYGGKRKIIWKEVLAGEKLDEAKTKLMVKFLGNFELTKNTMLVLPGRDENVVRAGNNLQQLQTLYVNTLNVYDILKAGKIILTQDALKGVEEVYA